MRTWIVRQWHRFTLGRTVTLFPALLLPDAVPGSMGYLADCIHGATRQAVPAGVVVEIGLRAATDLPRHKIRIVIEGA